MPDAGILATLLLLLGLFLLGLEFFIPSFGMILVTAVIALVVSFWSACKAWWGVSPYFFWTYVVMLTAGIPGSLLGAIAVIQRTSLGNRMILQPVESSEIAPPNPLEDLIGKRGTAQTLMTPGGIVLVDGERVHSESIGMLIEAQTPVIVVAVKGNRIVVRPELPSELTAVIAPSADASQNEILPEVTSEEEQVSATSSSPLPEPLDFDIPEDYTDKS
jgi:membrane-bound serine protease (ClpP class)